MKRLASSSSYATSSYSTSKLEASILSLVFALGYQLLILVSRLELKA